MFCFFNITNEPFKKRLEFFQKVRTRQQPIRTMSLIPVKIKVTIEQTIPLYKKLAPKIKELKILGIATTTIAKKLKINRKTVRKALLVN